MRLEPGKATYPLERPNHVLGVTVKAPTGGSANPSWSMVIRAEWEWLKQARKKQPDVRGWPVSFAVHDGNLEIWPWPDADYEVEIRQFPAYQKLGKCILY